MDHTGNESERERDKHVNTEPAAPQEEKSDPSAPADGVTPTAKITVPGIPHIPYPDEHIAEIRNLANRLEQLKRLSDFSSDDSNSEDEENGGAASSDDETETEAKHPLLDSFESFSSSNRVRGVRGAAFRPESDAGTSSDTQRIFNDQQEPLVQLRSSGNPLSNQEVLKLVSSFGGPVSNVELRSNLAENEDDEEDSDAEAQEGDPAQSEPTDGVSIERLKQNMEFGCELALQTGDFSTFELFLASKLLDSSQYTVEQQADILTFLADLLVKHPQVTYGIGMTLPHILLNYIETDYLFDKPMRDHRSIFPLMKLFQELATHGNPKELHIVSSELLSHLVYNPKDEQKFPAQVPGSGEPVYKPGEKYFNLKFHLLFELMIQSARNTQSRYPSNFLICSTAAILVLMRKNSASVTSVGVNFMLRRVYVFIRDYLPCRLPDDVDFTDEEFIIQQSEELAKQQKVLQSFVFYYMQLVFSRVHVQWAALLYSEIANGVADLSLQERMPFHQPNREESSIVEMSNRFADLCLSMDLDLDQMFIQLLELCGDVYPKVQNSGNLDQDILAVFTRENDSVNSQYLLEGIGPESFRYIFPETHDKLIVSSEGALIVCTNYFCEHRESLKLIQHVLTLENIVNLALTFMLYFNHGELQATTPGVRDSVCFWAWMVMKSAAAEEVQAVPHGKIAAFLQIIFGISATGSDQAMRKLAFTLCAKILSLTEEDFTYEFLRECLRECPYENVKAVLIGLLKNLVLRRRPAVKRQQSGTESETTDTFFMTLTEARKKDIKELIFQSLCDTFDYSLSDLMKLKTEPDSDTSRRSVSTAEFKVLLSWLNFLIATKQLDKQFVETVIEKTNLLAGVAAATEKDPITGESIPLSVLKIATDRLAESYAGQAS